MSLTDTACKAAKPRSTPYKVADGRGLSLLVLPSGARLWRFRYRIAGREQMLSLGTYPDTSLALARSKLEAARKLLAAGINPSEDRKQQRQALAARFSVIGSGYLDEHVKTLDADTARNERKRLEYLVAELDSKPLHEISPVDVAEAVRNIKKHHGHDTGKRAHGLANRIWQRAVLLGLVPTNPAAGFKATAAIGQHKTQSHPGITKPKRFTELLRAVDGYGGSPVTVAALKLQALLFLRPGKELLKGRWAEIDVAAGLWTVPASRMKMRREHLVPLPTQAVALLTELAKLTERGDGSLVFAGTSRGKPLSENTLNSALRRLDFNTRTEHCAHGFRTSASTMIREQLKPPIPSDAIEAQLAHKKPGPAGVYDRAEWLDDRRAMMQRWADYLDRLRKPPAF